ncbi:PTS sugar transporter subunit IIA [Candidatus Enterococcus murrayae]|uniref:PTS glucose transporter subunit IIA n=1 Tax=Candidatus Enterococcus murrayae TaxID=2815321 RepID=A0ABS3HHD4_9ENTE|nr:PTS glucose transporter subunit IIA [Enterococcus sp. MJM16]MBO0452862.1 PTS glucose transporter subunit IIA [Enterococcus sp. MJM16]
MFWNKKREIFAPVEGRFVDLTEVEDEVFSSGMMGQGCGIIPTGGTIVAPVDAEIISASPNMRHAMGLRLKNGCELLIHVGIDTVSLKNQGFSTLVSEGDQVKKGTELLKFDPQIIKEAGLKDTVMVIVTNTKSFSLEVGTEAKELIAGESVIMTIK